MAKNKNQHRKSFLLAGLSCFLLVACDKIDDAYQYDLDDKVTNPGIDTKQPLEAKNTYRFGFDLRSSPQEDARQYLPFLEYLEQETGLKFKLHFSSNKTDISDELGNNQVQFAAIGAVSFIKAKQKYDVVPLVRGLNENIRAEYQSMLVVGVNSTIKNISQVKGKRFAFGSMTSTQGHLIPRIILDKAGLTLNSLATYRYSGSHQGCANAVISNSADVCGMQDTMAKKMEKNGLLKIIHKSDFYPSSGIVASGKVPEEIRNRVKLAMLKFDPKKKHSKSLYNWHTTEMPLGFVEAKTEDYVDLKKWAIQFGFIKPIENE